MTAKRTPENNWNQTEKQIETLIHHYVDLQKPVQRAAFNADMSPTLGGIILKHKGLTRSPFDRKVHPWKKEIGAAISKRDAKQGEVVEPIR